jgi:hypothetical protein
VGGVVVGGGAGGIVGGACGTVVGAACGAAVVVVDGAVVDVVVEVGTVTAAPAAGSTRPLFMAAYHLPRTPCPLA